MTRIEKIEDYICNLCYEEFPIAAYPLIDLKESPELLEKILDKSLFEYTCPHCNQKLIVKYDFTCLHVDKTLLASVYWNDWTFAKASSFEHAYFKKAVKPNEYITAYPDYDSVIAKLKLIFGDAK